MKKIGYIENFLYKLRSEGPLIIPQIDPDKYSPDSSKDWFKNVKSLGIPIIAIGGSIVDSFNLQNLIDIAVRDYEFLVITYLTTNSISSLKGYKGKTAVYWMHVPTSNNTFYNWDGLISNSLSIEKNEFETLPTIYVFDDRGSIATSNWMTRAYPIPQDKPKISLAVAKAAEFLGIRFYIMAGGSGCFKPPPYKHVELLSKKTSLFVIPTSGINTSDQAYKLYKFGADALHIGNRLELPGGFNILKKIVRVSKKFPGKEFL
jgi:phosphoglycerol geranylgeranyltransferase